MKIILCLLLSECQCYEKTVDLTKTERDLSLEDEKELMNMGTNY